jgi:zinc protease
VELQRVTDGNIRNLPNRFETGGQLLGAMLDLRQRGLPDDYYDHLATLYRGIDAAAIDTAAARYLAPGDLAIIVVGDRQMIDSQLAALGSTLGMRIEYLDVAQPEE